MSERIQAEPPQRPEGRFGDQDDGPAYTIRKQESGGSGWILVLVVGLLLAFVLLCGGLLALGGAFFLLAAPGAAPAPAVVSPAPPQPEPAEKP